MLDSARMSDATRKWVMAVGQWFQQNPTRQYVLVNMPPHISEGEWELHVAQCGASPAKRRARKFLAHIAEVSLLSFEPGTDEEQARRTWARMYPGDLWCTIEGEHL